MIGREIVRVVVQRHATERCREDSNRLQHEARADLSELHLGSRLLLVGPDDLMNSSSKSVLANVSAATSSMGGVCHQ